MAEADAFWVRRGGPRGTGRLTAGLFMMGVGLFGVYHDRSRIDGPPEEQLVAVPAKLVAAECQPRKSNLRRAPRADDAARLLVRLEYVFEGLPYSGGQYQRQLGYAVGTMAACEQLVVKLRNTPSLQAWVDPAWPHFAVLSKELADDGLEWTLSGVGLVLALFGCRRLLSDRRKRA